MGSVHVIELDFAILGRRGFREATRAHIAGKPLGCLLVDELGLQVALGAAPAGGEVAGDGAGVLRERAWLETGKSKMALPCDMGFGRTRVCRTPTPHDG